MAKLIFGCGYLGRRVARLWCDAGEDVYAVTRSRERAIELASAGLRPIVADVTEPASLRELPAGSTVLFAVGHDRTAGKSITQVYCDGLRHTLAALPAETQQIMYISSTGVYGQQAGEIVDEDTPCHPDREGGRACLALSSC